MTLRKCNSIVIIGPSGPYSGLQTHSLGLANYFRSRGYSVRFIPVHWKYERVGTIFSLIATRLYWLYALLLVYLDKPCLVICTAIGRGYSFISKHAPSSTKTVCQVVTTQTHSALTNNGIDLESFDLIAYQTRGIQDALIGLVSSDLNHLVCGCFHQIDDENLHITKLPPLSVGIRLAYFGRLAENKGLFSLIQAFQNAQLPANCSLDIWGTGPSENDLRRLVSDEMNVSIMGKYPMGDAYTALLQTYHGVVVPSINNEGLPLVILEAASVGLPVFTSSVGSINSFTNLNPDVVVFDPLQGNISSQLHTFCNWIASSHFDRQRILSLYKDKYSKKAISRQWDALLTFLD